MLKVYISTPKPTGVDYKALAEKYGYELVGLNTHTKEEESKASGYVAAMNACDFAIVNCVFDTCEPYCDVAFEMGYLWGISKPIVGVLDDMRICIDKYDGEKSQDEKGTWRDANGLSLENTPLNLMLQYGGKIIEGTDIEDGFKEIEQNGLPEVIEDVPDRGLGLRGNKYAYMAGFEMFWPNGWERGIHNEDAAKAVGIDGVFPLRPIPEESGLVEYEPKDDSKYEKMKKGFLHDTKVMRSCDWIIANLSLFRDGHQPDSGTVFECGGMYAMGKKCYAFYDDPVCGLGPITRYCMKLAQGPVEAACELAAKDL